MKKLVGILAVMVIVVGICGIAMAQMATSVIPPVSGFVPMGDGKDSGDGSTIVLGAIGSKQIMTIAEENGALIVPITDLLTQSFGAGAFAIAEEVNTDTKETFSYSAVDGVVGTLAYDPLLGLGSDVNSPAYLGLQSAVEALGAALIDPTTQVSRLFVDFDNKNIGVSDSSSFAHALSNMALDTVTNNGTLDPVKLASLQARLAESSGTISGTDLAALVLSIYPDNS
ncbi:MAG: hypothetical protein NTZ48_04870 [Candidatus Omnitrophica bacterium]|nr:hypothetical protein [Candidatus Omnitrophota bacterium]